MSAEWVTALSAAATLIVITASAIAAVLQIRHLRGGNQIIALNELREKFNSTDFTDALMYVLRDLPVHMEDREIRRQLIASPLPREFVKTRIVGNFFENLGLLVKRGILDGDVVCDLWGEAIRNAWTALAPLIANRRHHLHNPASFDNFEYLAAVAFRFKREHPTGTYPAGMERMPSPPLWDSL